MSKPQFHETKEYQLGHQIALLQRDNLNETLGDILTLIEAISTNAEQCEATKKLTRQFMWKLADTNQRVTYRVLGVQPDVPIPATEPK